MLIRVCQQKVSFHFSMLVYDFIRLKDHIFSQQRHIKRVLEVYSKKGWCADNNDIVDNSKQPLHCFFYKSVRAFPTCLSLQHPLRECAKEWKTVKLCQSLFFIVRKFRIHEILLTHNALIYNSKKASDVVEARRCQTHLDIYFLLNQRLGASRHFFAPDSYTF